jgi:hypothetical protein
MESAGRVVRTGERVAGSAAPGLGAIGVFVPAGVRRAMAVRRAPRRVAHTVGIRAGPTRACPVDLRSSLV